MNDGAVIAAVAVLGLLVGLRMGAKSSKSVASAPEKKRDAESDSFGMVGAQTISDTFGAGKCGCS